MAFLKITSVDTTYKLNCGKNPDINNYQISENGICHHRLVKNTAVCIGASLFVFGFLYTLPEEATSWRKNEINLTSLTNEWGTHVSSGPIWDGDGYVYNYIFHPYCGAIYYMGARGAGYKVLPSFLYTTCMSTFYWEYGIEAFAEVPSTQDIIVTPVAGSLLGEGFFALKKNIRSNDDRLFGKRWAGIMTLWVIDPLNQFVDLLEGDRCRNNFSTSGIIVPARQNIFYSFSLRLNFR